MIVEKGGSQRRGNGISKGSSALYFLDWAPFVVNDAAEILVFKGASDGGAAGIVVYSDGRSLMYKKLLGKELRARTAWGYHELRFPGCCVELQSSLD